MDTADNRTPEALAARITRIQEHIAKLENRLDRLEEQPATAPDDRITPDSGST
jgi:prefoldin subunit 5